MFKQVISWILDNLEWFFSGIGVFVLGLFITKFSRSSKKESSTRVNQSRSLSRNQGSVVAGRDIIINSQSEKEDSSSLGGKRDIQNKIHILFIDDEEFQVVQMLKNDGWKAVSRIDDPSSIRAQEILDSEVVFVDIIGIGKALGFKNQGIGLAAEIKRRYPNKRVVIYSGEEKHSVFDSDLHSVDNWLPKNAEPIQFIQEIESYASSRD